MPRFQPPSADRRPPGAPVTDADFRSSTLQPDPDDPVIGLRRSARARPGWMVPALVATVLVLTLTAAGWAWYAG